MKKVWILEKFSTPEDLKKDVDIAREMVDHLSNTNIAPDQLALAKENLENWIHTLENNTEGMWTGCQGSTNYYTFCSRAKNYIREKDAEAIATLKSELGKTQYSDEIKKMFRNAHEAVRSQYRVIEGEIEDSAKTWIGYKTIKENPGVYKYLWATRG